MVKVEIEGDGVIEEATGEVLCSSNLEMFDSSPTASEIGKRQTEDVVFSVDDGMELREVWSRDRLNLQRGPIP